ncbi:MAG: hypothetical protein ACI80V_001539 [Rhodothermales bacterium]|jgi:hypothetical protein
MLVSIYGIGRRSQKHQEKRGDEQAERHRDCGFVALGALASMR